MATPTQARARQERETFADLRVRFPMGDCHVTTIADPNGLTLRGGMTVPVPLDIAAQRLVAGTHRLSTSEEVQAWEAQQANEARAIRAAAPTRGAVYIGKDGAYRV